jgi:hypothetical protein
MVKLQTFWQLKKFSPGNNISRKTFVNIPPKYFRFILRKADKINSIHRFLIYLQIRQKPLFFIFKKAFA